DMLASCDDQRIFKLNHRIGKTLLIADVGAAEIGDFRANKVDGEQSGTAIITTLNPQVLGNVSEPPVCITIVDQRIVDAKAGLVDQSRIEGPGPIGDARISRSAEEIVEDERERIAGPVVLTAL